MKFGLLIPLAAPYATREFVHRLGTLAEQHGFDSLWVGEHVVVPFEWVSKYPLDAQGKIPSAVQFGELDPYTTLSFLAALTQRIRLGACTVVPQRNPVYTAKEIANADWLSNGRIDFGAGVGWSKEEFDAVAAPFERRGERGSAYLRLMKKLWTQPDTDFADEYYSMPRSLLYPKPLQRPHPPIHILGQSSAAIRRAAQIGDGLFPIDQSPEQMADVVRKLRAEMSAAGRPHHTVAISVTPYTSPCDLDTVRRYEEAGVDQVVLFRFVEEYAHLEPAVAEFAEEILEPGRN